MEVLQLTTTVDASEHLHLEIPTQLLPGKVNIVILLSPVTSDSTKKSNYDFSNIAGKLVWQGDALAIQKVLRDEW
ncbi:hypothetical protein IQ244_01220 [Nostoc sp. LEGE 06077]|uniref:hypothetical protein n=1 Tax=Nostoc sp. LEGE 06077 TaxID=915325 RepID=UPI0018812F4C|nr:hypothetical protein [Nostoc sp. LEGE 06077]MBE9205178.1 hypothetical protein [Nostoc sp. LEGE 06077]